jgi:hypothetical protein
MYSIDWKVIFKTSTGDYSLNLIAAIDIESSVDTLCDTAVISLPEAVMNQVLNVQDIVTRGVGVTIQAGYDGDLKTEFVGYVLDVRESEGSLKIMCEDALFVFRKVIKDQEIKPTSLQKIAQVIVDQIDPSFSVKCDYEIGYEKFVIHQATGYDVLKKLAEETKANIYFNSDKKELHIHPPYSQKGGTVIYSMQRNVENSSLEFKKAIDRKVEVTIESTNLKGQVEKFTAGSTGGDTVTLKIGSVQKADMAKIAKSELLRRSADMYEGSIDTWLVPFVQPSYSAKIIDKDYPLKDGSYYVVGITSSISEAGAKRTVKLGIKLSV